MVRYMGMGSGMEGWKVGVRVRLILIWGGGIEGGSGDEMRWDWTGLDWIGLG